MKKIRNLERRVFLKQTLSLGALSMLAGCDLTNDEQVTEYDSSTNGLINYFKART